MILTGTRYRPLGAPPARGATADVQRDLSFLQVSYTSRQYGANLQSSAGGQAPDNLTLALKILGTFDFSGHVLNEFVREAALPYLEHDDPDVRKEAVLASTQLMVHDPICHQTSMHSIEVVSDILGKLLRVSITDSGRLSCIDIWTLLELTFSSHHTSNRP